LKGVSALPESALLLWLLASTLSLPNGFFRALTTDCCVPALRRRDIALVRVPGAFEIPLAARTLAETRKYDAIICIGCLLRGDTAHYDVIVNEVTRGIGQSAQETGVPHAFGVLTCETLEQAIDRAGLKMGNKGLEAALAAVEMANLKGALSSSALSCQERQGNPNFGFAEHAKAKPRVNIRNSAPAPVL
jgi:6,7-dimethyl-8-ribityllumazine synthase